MVVIYYWVYVWNSFSDVADCLLGRVGPEKGQPITKVSGEVWFPHQLDSKRFSEYPINRWEIVGLGNAGIKSGFLFVALREW